MTTYEFDMSLSAEEVRSIYAGRTRFIVVKSDKGLKLQLPASNFRSHVTSEGIHGRFRVTIDANNRIRDLRKL